MRKIYLLSVLIVCATEALWGKTSPEFDWRGATVYFVITDRFANGDSTNDVNYGRKVDYGSERLNAATFHGGDFSGMLQKAREGYFKELGVDVVWMTDVYEQIHGWMSGSGSINDFPHYGYHGYYPLDYTQTDKNYGTVEEFRALVDTLHAQGIRVMLGANLNDPGYPTLLDAVQYGFADTGLSEEEAAQHIREWSYDDFFARRGAWKGWYDRGWIRMPDEGWDESNPLEATLYGMPDFKDESKEAVKIPAFLKRKWAGEKHRNDAWVNPAARKLRNVSDRTPMQHVTGWIASWVEEFGIDGFRCDVVEYVHPECWKALKGACDEALAKWRRNHKGTPGAEWTEEFYMTGDFDDASIDFKPMYADAGFGSMVNCRFPKKGEMDGIAYVWQAYADSLSAHENWGPLSYLNNSYHRDTDMDNMRDCATTMLLCPGAVQIFYGDETGRGLSDARLNADSNQAFRSDMNWASIDSTLLNHFRRLGQIRKANPVIATGRQTTYDSRSVLRYNDKDSVLIVINPEGGRDVNVHGAFADGTEVAELYTGQRSKVSGGKVKFPKYEGGVAVIRRCGDDQCD